MQLISSIVIGCLILSLFSTSSRAGLAFFENSDVATAQADFANSSNAIVLFNWSNFFPPNSHTLGQITPVIFSVPSLATTLFDGTINTAEIAFGTPQNLSLNLGNHIDGPGFNGENNFASPDLAVNGIESFNLLFGKDHFSIGFAIATGTGNDLNEVNLNGASFEITAKNALEGIVGSINLSLAPGSPESTWLTLISDELFRTIEIREIGSTHIADQYFGYIWGDSVVPESSSFLSLFICMATILFRRHHSS